MVSVTFNKEGMRYGLKLKGHADYDIHGKDIVCAGVSSAVYALIGYINNCDYIVIHKLEVQSGDVDVDISVKDKADLPRFDAAVQVCLIGLLQLEKTYPKNICVSIKK